MEACGSTQAQFSTLIFRGLITSKKKVIFLKKLAEMCNTLVFNMAQQQGTSLRYMTKPWIKLWNSFPTCKSGRLSVSLGLYFSKISWTISNTPYRLLLGHFYHNTNLKASSMVNLSLLILLYLIFSIRQSFKAANFR